MFHVTRNSDQRNTISMSLLDGMCQRQAVQFGQPNINQEEIDSILGEECKQILSPGPVSDFIAVDFEPVAHQET